ncbi:MAG: hypothetical protein P4L33_04670 [Capsulimonadaceae bacterium]|nr:hypothetical protein [Capsulimonadaceae bacterium]
MMAKLNIILIALASLITGAVLSGCGAAQQAEAKAISGTYSNNFNNNASDFSVTIASSKALSGYLDNYPTGSSATMTGTVSFNSDLTSGSAPLTVYTYNSSTHGGGTKSGPYYYYLTFSYANNALSVNILSSGNSDPLGIGKTSGLSITAATTYIVSRLTSLSSLRHHAG